MLGRSLLAGAWMLAAASWGAASALASNLASPAAGQQLKPGTVTAITWPRREEARGFDEMELVLSLDGGKTFPLRVTRRIDPSASGFLWDVPALPTAHARLALRAGSDEDKGSERILVVSGEFSIVSGPSLPLEPIFWVDGEARTRDALEGPPPPSLPGSSLNGRSEPELSSDSLDASTPEKGPEAAAQRGRAPAIASSVSTPVGRQLGLPIRPGSSVRLPMRE